MMVEKLLSRGSEGLRMFEKQFGFQTEVKWLSVCVVLGYHALGVYWCYHYAFPVRWQTVVFAIYMGLVNGVGITAGAHRYWSHRSYKATRPLEYLLLFMFSTCGQTTVLRFVRNHRLHHQCSDTASDPHDATRGLFYSHMGWLMLRKHPETIRKGRQLDISDITGDPLLMFQERYMMPINLVCCFLLPLGVNLLWKERWQCALAWQWFIRFFLVLHCEMTVNSLAHRPGRRPFNKTIRPSESLLVSTLTLGEGSHNYHHVFPSDYKASREVTFSIATYFIKLCEFLGLAYDLKEASPQAVQRMIDRVGDKME